MFELLDNYVDLAAASRKRVRPPPLGLEEWGAFLDSEGRLVNESGFKQRVFYSGATAHPVLTVDCAPPPPPPFHSHAYRHAHKLTHTHTHSRAHTHTHTHTER
jgi:hypothetical protein